MLPLAQCKLFTSLTPPEMESLMEVAREQVYVPGTVIFRQGDRGDGIYVVKDGQVLISAVLNPGDARILTRLGPGELFGEMAVLDNEPRSATASAEQLTVLYFIPQADLHRLLKINQGLSYNLNREISGRLRDFNRQYINEVLQAERLALVGRFASSIVHDLKNPLNIISISAEMAAMESSTAEFRNAATDRIARQVERISDMINELLDFTRPSNSSVVLAATDYAEFVAQLVAEMRPEVALKSVSIELLTPPPALLMNLNPPRLRRVFYNLLHNATDAMPSGGKIYLRFTETATEVITEVEDTGPGIAPEIGDQIFQAFATYGKAHGTGLGLSICKRIILDHHGKIYVRNHTGRGAVFVFHLPKT